MRNLVCQLVAFGLLCSGCGVATSDLNAEIYVRVVEGDLAVTAMFVDSEHNEQDPSGTDVVTTFRGREFKHTHSESFYAAVIALETPLVADEPISVAVLRDGETDAPSSTINVPPLPDLSPMPLFISRAEPLTLSWSTVTDDEMYWELDSHCARGASEIPPNVGAFTIDPTEIKTTQERTCSATLTVGRSRVAPVDAAFAGGEMSFRYATAIAFASTP